MRRYALGCAVVMCLAVAAVSPAGAATWTVGPGGPPSYDFASIQPAINAAAVSGDTVQVAGGTYYEHLMWMDKSIALLAMEHEVPVIIGYARRLSNNFEYELGCNRIIKPAEWKNRDNELHWLTQEYTQAIEDCVRKAPEQYLWIHRRWKSRPREETAQQPANTINE